MANPFEEFPLTYRVAQGRPSEAESKFPEPGPNKQPGYLGRTLSLRDYGVTESCAPGYINVNDPNFRK